MHGKLVVLEDGRRAYQLGDIIYPEREENEIEVRDKHNRIFSLMRWDGTSYRRGVGWVPGLAGLESVPKRLRNQLS